MKTRIRTDTATIVVFDPACLSHRRSDDCDWWSIEREELLEVNAGNALFLGVGSDGFYEVEITNESPPDGARIVSAHLKVESGKLFVGGGEWTPGDDLETEATHGNVFVDARPGPYRVQAWIERAGCVRLKIDRAEEFSPNAFVRSPKIA